ncbi:hypothetical protein AKJ64_02700 [candidate division MSBL1 archaeon SCGC-AAA259E17]|uniref:Uncharacterized protein n=1 Tax=candidate division MSBL1 archaeon SCGC-AAA259E17 TaxID=1698263 RepID=A0A133UEJ6_9EURY|nr:hypothetical protein AKJ64_02700 [candidate division MSBL1 archaeon SCGC-AAA259E17]
MVKKLLQFRSCFLNFLGNGKKVFLKLLAHQIHGKKEDLTAPFGPTKAVKFSQFHDILRIPIELDLILLLLGS